MKIRRLMVLIALGMMSFPVIADFRTTMEVYEVELVHLTLPASENGVLSFSECGECEVLSIRATAATRYTINGRNVSLADFRKAIAGIADRNRQMIDVFHDLELNTLRAVEVKL